MGNSAVASSQQQRNRRRRGRLRYEDTVAWLIVPVILVALLYGLLELARQLSGTPLGKFLGW